MVGSNSHYGFEVPVLVVTFNGVCLRHNKKHKQPQWILKGNVTSIDLMSPN